MLFDPSTSQALQPWLVKTLEPICDAEPEALATYILALLKHDAPEHDLHQELVRQLDEFFEDGATSFVDTLFSALRSKSYIPYATEPSPFPPSSSGLQDAGIPIPLDALISPSQTSPDRGTKRAYEADDKETRGPPKGPRLGNDAYFARRANGYGADNWQRGPTDGFRGDTMDGGMQNGHPHNQRVMLPKGVCRDYHLKGFCSRGAMCKYTHDEGAFAPQMPLPVNVGMPFMGMYGGMPFPGAPMQPTAYDPNEPRMDMRQRGPHQRIPTMPHAQNGAESGPMFQTHGEPPVIQDLTPARPSEPTAGSDGTSSQAYTPSGPSTGGASDVHMNATSGEHSLYGTFDMNGAGSAGLTTVGPNGRPKRGTNPGFRGRGRGGRGTFRGDHQSFGEGESGRKSKTIVVEKIPEEKLTLEAVNDWFKRFGTVTNVAVDVHGKKALVSFSSHEEARVAWSAEEAVFNNRFVKIFWHRPMEGQGTFGARALQASASFVAGIAAREHGPASTPDAPTPPRVSKLTTPSKLTSLEEKQQQLLEKQIAEQKELMGKLAAASPEEKKDIMARLRKLNAEMKAPAIEKTSPPPHSRAASVTADNKERRTKELLDMELEARAKSGEEGGPAENEETRESLQQKLEKLRAEAEALGITDISSPQTTYRGFRGRGRGRGRATFRGAMRGGPPRGSMKLDNRPKTLLVKGVSSHDPEVVQAVRTWYEASGQLSSLDVHDNESLIARFHSRPAAEQALAKGSNIPSAGIVKLSWHIDTTTPKPEPAISHATTEKKPAGAVEERPPSPRPEDVAEEFGWGNEEDDGMGMGGF